MRVRVRGRCRGSSWVDASVTGWIRYNMVCCTSVAAAAGRRKFDAKNLPPDAFVQTYSAVDAVELVRTVVEGKNEFQIGQSLDMVTRMLHENPLSSAVELAEQGICGLLDTLLSNKWQDAAMTSRILGVLMKLVEDPSLHAQQLLLSAATSANDTASKAVDLTANVKRVRSYFSGSTTIFRLVKLAPAVVDDELAITLLVQILVNLSRSEGKPPPLPLPLSLSRSLSLTRVRLCAQRFWANWSPAARASWRCSC